ncbi:MAG: hypothetical protein ACYC8T_26325, partial [Myxococcaceae bacterium]
MGIVVVLAGVVARPAGAAETQIGEPTRQTMVVLDDAAPPRLHELDIEYTAFMSVALSQEGRASKIPEHPIDDRVCNATIDVRLQRRLVAERIAGGLATNAAALINQDRTFIPGMGATEVAAMIDLLGDQPFAHLAGELRYGGGSTATKILTGLRKMVVSAVTQKKGANCAEAAWRVFFEPVENQYRLSGQAGLDLAPLNVLVLGAELTLGSSRLAFRDASGAVVARAAVAVPKQAWQGKYGADTMVIAAAANHERVLREPLPARQR